MSWRTFAVGLVGGLVLATVLELPLRWYLPSIFVDGWPSIDPRVATALSVGGLLLVVACGALAARLDRAASRRQAVSAGAVAGLIAALVADALVGAPAAAVWGTRHLLSRGSLLVADQADWFRLAHGSIIGTYDWTFASPWIAAALGLALGALGGILRAPREPAGRRTSLPWPSILVVCLLGCAVAIATIVLFSPGRFTMAIEDAISNVASLPFPLPLPLSCLQYALATILPLAGGFGLFFVLQLLSYRTLQRMPQASATDHGMWRVLSVGTAAAPIVLTALAIVALTDATGSQDTSPGLACITTPLRSTLFLGVTAALAVGAIAARSLVRIWAVWDQESLPVHPSRTRYYGTVLIGACLSGLTICLLAIAPPASIVSLTQTTLPPLWPMEVLATSASSPTWEGVKSVFFTLKFAVLLSILLGSVLAILVADAVWIAEWRAQRRADRSSVARPMRMITSLLGLSLLSLLLVVAICALLGGAWWSLGGMSGLPLPAPQWHWTTILAPPMVVALFVVTALGLAIYPATRRIGVARRLGVVGCDRGCTGVLLAIIVAASLWFLPTAAIRWAGRLDCQDIASPIMAWEDEDGDGVQDPGESPLSHIALTWGFPLSEPPKIATLTGADGQSEHTYPSCAIDQVTIRAYAPTGYQPTTPTSQRPDSQGAEVRFGFQRTSPETEDPAWHRALVIDELGSATVRLGEDGILEVDLGPMPSSTASDIEGNLHDVISTSAGSLPFSKYVIEYIDRGRSWRACYPSAECILGQGEALPRESTDPANAEAISTHPEVEVITDVGTVTFPEAISLDLTLDEGDANVRSLWLEYGVPDAACMSTSGSEGVAFMQGWGQLSASWQWDDPNASLTPGTRFWWRWHVKTDTGTFITPTHWDVWVDSDDGWRSVSSEGLTVHWSDTELAAAQSIAQAAIDARAAVGAELRIDTLPEFDLLIYGSDDDMRLAVPGLPDWAGGAAFSYVPGAILSSDGSGLAWARRAAAHETSHVVLSSMSCNGFPAWLNEGLAMLAEGQPDESYSDTLAEAVENQSLLPLRDLISSFGGIADEDQASLAYAQAQSIVKYLVDTYGIEKMADLVHKRADYSMWTDKALEEVYGFDMDGLEAEWRAFVGAQAG